MDFKKFIDGIWESTSEDGKYYGTKKDYYADRLSGKNELYAYKTSHKRKSMIGNVGYLKNSAKRMI